jgi:uncharacterized protein (TIGR03437 family)
MERNRKLLIKLAVAGTAIPILLWAYEYGPDPGYSGVPLEHGGATCATTGCHTGTANNPANKGSVSVTFPNGQTYVPGVKQHLTVTIADPAATQQAWGFQLTARVSGTPSAMAGFFAFTDANTLLMCSQPNFVVLQAQCQNAKSDGCANTTTTCPLGESLQYIEHSLTGYTSTKGPGSGSYQFDWTPPATNVGNVVIYVAANAGPPGPPSQDNGHIYSTTYTLTPSAGGNTPTITAGGVVSGASFQPGIVPDSWLTITGTNLSPVTDTWDKAISNGKLPTVLDGVSVNVGSKPAYVQYISSTQINVQAPDVGTGPVPVTVTTPNGTSAAVTATVVAQAPAFFLWPNSQVVATRNSDASLAVKAGTFAGATTVAAKPGDVLILWGTGFGPTTPTVAAGIQVPSDKVYNASPVTVKLGTANVQVFGTALSPGFAGLYQVAIQVPTPMADGDYALTATVSGASSPSGVILSVKN